MHDIELVALIFVLLDYYDDLRHNSVKKPELLLVFNIHSYKSQQ